MADVTCNVSVIEHGISATVVPANRTVAISLAPVSRVISAVIEQGVRGAQGPAGAAGAGEGVGASAGASSIGTGILRFSNLNGVSFGLSGSTLTASHNALTTAMASNAGSNFMSTSERANYLTTAMQSGAGSLFMSTSERANYYATAGNTLANSTHSHGALALTNINGTTASNGLSLSAVIPAQSVQTQNSVQVLGSSGNVSFGNANGITFGGNASTITASHNALTTAAQSNHSHGAVAATNINATSASNGLSLSVPAQTEQTQSRFNLTLAGATAGVLALISSGVMSFAGGNNITLSQNGNAVTISAANAGGAQTGISGISAGTTQLTSGTIVFSNSNGLSFGVNGSTLTASHNGLTTAAQSNHSHGNPTLNLTNISGTTASNSNGLTLSLSAAAPGAGGGVSPAAGTQTATSGTVNFANSNGISFGMSGSNQITASYTVPLIPGATSFSNLNNVSFGLNGSTITASASYPTQTVQTQNIHNVTIGGNTAGAGAAVSSGTLTIAGGNNITISQAGNALTISGANVGGAQTGISGVAAAGGTVTSGTVSFSNLNGVSFGINGNTLTASHNGLTTAMLSNASSGFMLTGERANYLTTAMLSNAGSGFMSTSERGNYFYTSNNTLANSTHTHGNPTLNLTNISGTTASGSGGFTLSLSAAAGGGGADGYNILAAGTQTAGTASTINFANSNGISFGMSGSSQITASHNGLTTAMLSNAGSNFVGTNSALTANGVSATVNSSGVSLNFPAFLTTAQAPGAYLTTAALSNHGHGVSLNLTNINGTTNSNSAGISLSLSAVVPSQSVQTQGMVSFNDQTGALSRAVGSSLSSSVNGVSTTLGLASNITTALQSAGAYLTTAMASNASTAFAGTGSGFTGGAAISATITHNTLGMSLSLSHPAWLTTALQSQMSSNYMSTAERGNYFATNAYTFAHSTHSHGNPALNLTNLSGTTASNSAGLTISLSAAAPGAGGGVAIGAGTQTATSGTLVFANSNGVSFGMSGSSQITATVQPGAAAGIAAINNSNTTYTSGTIQLTEGGGAITIASNTGQRFAFSVPATSSLSGVNLTIATNGSTISISAAAPGGGGGVAIIGSNTTYTSGSVSFVGSGAITIGSNTGQRIVVSAPAQSYMSGINITINTNGSTISLSGAGDRTMSTFFPVDPGGSTQSQTLGAMGASTASLMLFPFMVDGPVWFNAIQVPLNLSYATSSVSGRQTISSFFGLYTAVSDTISLISSNSFSIDLTNSSVSATINYPRTTATNGYVHGTTTHTGTAQAQSLFGTAGLKIVDLQFGNTMSVTQGMYWLGVMLRHSSTSANIGISAALHGAACPVVNNRGVMGSASSAMTTNWTLRKPLYGLGAYTSTGSADYSGIQLPSSVLVTGMNQSISVRPYLTLIST
jgi:hypothetical protein